MTLYHFNPNNWGAEFYVMSASEENAIIAFNKHQVVLFEEELKDIAYRKRWHEEDINEPDYEPYDDTGDQKEPYKWGDKKFEHYTIDEYGEDEIKPSEIA